MTSQKTIERCRAKVTELELNIVDLTNANVTLLANNVVLKEKIG